MPKITELTIDLIYTNEQWHDLKDLEQQITHAANAACDAACQLGGEQGPFEVAINLSDDAQVAQLNQQFRGKDKPTNVLSFPFEDDFPELNQGPRPLGDIILAFETISREALEQDKPVGHHIAHLVVHGILHLFGYDHMERDDANEMEELEQQILSSLQIPSPYREQ